VTKEIEMNQGIRLFVYPVKDIARAKALYSKLLGVEPYVDTAYYVGFKVGDQEIGLDPNGHSRGITAPLGYLDVDDIRQNLQSLQAAGAQVQQEVTDVGGGLLIASVKDADGNVTGLRQTP
jgi:predicted enzyme related to lactoylglutathione lyase